jgi:hypothetical protein
MAGFATVAGADVMVVEGQSFAGQVVDVGCAQSSGTIDWGDGSTSAGVSDGGTGVDGTHTYAAAGIYNASVSYTCPQFGASSHTASFQATVQDAPLTGSGIAITGTAGQGLSAVVAHFGDANPFASAGDFSGQINWGDGSTTAGSVTSAAGGGFDVTGTHTYSATGSYPVSTTITDTGGSVTSADSTAQIAAPAPFPPLPGPPAPAAPPPAPTLGPPVAQFTYAPKRPCVGDRIAFDASKSTGQGLRIIRYRWPQSGTFMGVPFPTEVFTTPTGYSPYGIGYNDRTEIIGQPAADYVVVDYNPIDGTPQPHHFPAFHVEIISHPVDVTLQVVARDGETASITHRITFRNPKQNVVIAYENGIVGGPSGGPGVTDPIGIVNWGQACDSQTLLQKVELSTLKLRPAVLLHRPSGALHLSGASATVTVGIPCRYAQLGCDGTVELLLKSSARHRASRTPAARELGLAQFLAPAGRRSARVAIKLNAYGGALARAHKLGRVRLRLLSAGSNGRLSTSTRAIIIVGGRPVGGA